jgi:Tol biopolymer transport system component
VYRVGAGGNLNDLTWLDEQGKSLGTVGQRASYLEPLLSPDGKHIAFSQLNNQTGNSNIGVLDLIRGASTALTFDTGGNRFPLWSPDGKTIAFASNRSGHFDLYRKPADGSSEETVLLKSEHDKRPNSWSLDGRFLLFEDFDPKTGRDLWILPMTGDPKPFPFLRTPFDEFRAAFSPDGRYVAYVSTESGVGEVYVRPFMPDKTGEGAKWAISNGHGGGFVFPRWRRDGKQLFYTQNFQQMAVDVSTEKTFQSGAPRRLFDVHAPSYLVPDISADGARFLYGLFGGTDPQAPFVVVLNWQSALKK